MGEKMKYIPIKSLALKGMILTFLLANILPAQLEFSGDVTGVSTYVWRGVKQYNGNAMQGTANLTVSMFSFGFWISSVNFGPDGPSIESDPFFEIALPTGDEFSTTIGTTIYTYDFFDTFNDDSKHEVEIYGKVGIGSFGASVFFVPSQSSTKNNLNDSDYWVELSAQANTVNADFSAILSFGTYSSKYIPEPQKDPVYHLVLSASKPLMENLSAGMNLSLGLSKELSNLFWIYISVGI
jgi:uncharacterized protein (TIGR02001 family)